MAMLVAAVVVATAPRVAIAQQAAPDVCGAGISAQATLGDRSAVTVHITGVPALPAGTLMAYAGDRAWSGARGPYDSRQDELGVQDNSFVVRAGGAIEGLTFTPIASSCTLYAIVHAPQNKPDPVATRPTIVLSHDEPLLPPACAKPFADPSVRVAVEPDTPYLAFQQGIAGVVHVLVTIDERGTATATHVLSSPSQLLNGVSESAARRSTYQPAVFRCKPVPGSYVFSVSFG